MNSTDLITAGALAAVAVSGWRLWQTSRLNFSRNQQCRLMALSTPLVFMVNLSGRLTEPADDAFERLDLVMLVFIAAGLVVSAWLAGRLAAAEDELAKGRSGWHGDDGNG